jgi:hypothetical protein
MQAWLPKKDYIQSGVAGSKSVFYLKKDEVPIATRLVDTSTNAQD